MDRFISFFLLMLGLVYLALLIRHVTMTLLGAPPTLEARESVKTTEDGIYNRIEIGGKCYLSNEIWCIPCDGGQALNCDEVRESVKMTQDGVYNRIEIGGECYLSDGHWCIPCDGGQALNCDEARELTQDGEDN